MAKEGEISISGKFGKQYNYNIYPINTEFKDLPGNYDIYEAATKW